MLRNRSIRKLDRRIFRSIPLNIGIPAYTAGNITQGGNIVKLLINVNRIKT